MNAFGLFRRAAWIRVALAAALLAAFAGQAAPVRPLAARAPDLTAFRGLGAWIDIYDYNTNAWEATGIMKDNGIKTVYLQTGRWNSPSTANTAAFTDKRIVDWWLHAAHARGMKVVGWYLPAYENMIRDVRRTTMIHTYRTGYGHRFDGVAIDIEYKGQMPSSSAWNAAVLEHAKRVRSALGYSAPVAAITPAPVGMAIRPSAWAGFPWRGLAQVSNVFMPMGYWSYRTDCGSNPKHCPHGYTELNITETRRLTGNYNALVHAIGGVADRITAGDVSEFVLGAQHAKAIGVSLYDYRTTGAALWAPLRAF